MENLAVINGITLINLTPHPINIILGNGEQIVIPAPVDKGSKVPRLEEEVVEDFTIGEIPVVRKVYKKAVNLPDPTPNTFFIVSGLVASAVRREDLLVPNTVRLGRGSWVRVVPQKAPLWPVPKWSRHLKPQ